MMESLELKVNGTAQKTEFSIKDSSVNMTKSPGNCGFGYFYWSNP